MYVYCVYRDLQTEGFTITVSCNLIGIFIVKKKYGSECVKDTAKKIDRLNTDYNLTPAVIIIIIIIDYY